MGGGYPRDLDPDSRAFWHIVRSHRDVYEDAAGCIKAAALGGDRDPMGGGIDQDSRAKGGNPAAGEVARRW